MSRLLLHAPNVHQGGGRVLLHLLIDAALARGNCQFILDARLPLPPGVREADVAGRIQPTIIGRLGAETLLRKLAQPEDVVLSFGNLPPLLRLPCRVFVFVQNRLLLEQGIAGGLPWRVRVRVMVERAWLRLCSSNADRYLVQTATMHRLLQEALGRPAEIAPFAACGQPASARAADGRTWRFVYVASGEPHKNHRRLIEAWSLLAERGAKPILDLTLERSREPELVDWIEARAAAGKLNINLNAAPDGDVSALYRRADALVYPSILESFGLPLVEARAHRLAIIAGELDGVRDVLDPQQAFDPYSPLSIARAVERFMGNAAPPAIDTPAEFLDRLHR